MVQQDWLGNFIEKPYDEMWRLYLIHPQDWQSHKWPKSVTQACQTPGPLAACSPQQVFL